MQVRICTGKPTTIVASKKGFYPSGKRALSSHTLAGLLKQISRIFDSVSEDLCYELPFFLRYSAFQTVNWLMFVYFWFISSIQAFKALMKAFTEHNKVSDFEFEPKTTVECINDNDIICICFIIWSVWESSIWFSSKHLVSTLCCCWESVHIPSTSYRGWKLGRKWRRTRKRKKAWPQAVGERTLYLSTYAV